jgi:hypothetical protein
MKIFSAAGPLSRAAARNCLLVNQFATPGLGSLMGRRRVAGSLQLLLAVVGFAGVTSWFIGLFADLYREMSDLPPQVYSYSWLGKAGSALFVVAWLWSWVTSFSLLREAAKNDSSPPPAAAQPPRI